MQSIRSSATGVRAGGVMMVTFTLTSTVLAQGVGNLGALPTSFETTIPPVGWVLVHPTGGPIPVVRDPLGPAWPKHLTGPAGQPVQVFPFQSYAIQEALIVSGNLPWSDWHSQVVNPDWIWTSPSILVNGAPPSGLSISNTGDTLSFYFDQINPGSTVFITASLTYAGQPGQVFNGTLELRQFPTPEPATLGLLALGAPLISRRRNRATRG